MSKHVSILDAVHTTLTVAIVALFAVAAPGPKYEEIFSLILFSGLMFAYVAIMSGFRPNLYLNVCLFALGHSAGWGIMVWKIARDYGYSVLEIPALRLGIAVTVIGSLLVAVQNIVRRAFTSGRMSDRSDEGRLD